MAKEGDQMCVMISASEDGTLKIWDVDDEKKVACQLLVVSQINKGVLTRKNIIKKEEFIKARFINYSWIFCATPSSILIYDLRKAMFILNE